MSESGRPEQRHLPVLLQETITALALQANDNAVDCTVGAGGHAAAILERTAPGGRLLGFDLDEAALEAARSRLAPFGSRAVLVRGNYKDVERVLLTQGFGPVQAALLDLGFSSLEIDDPARGFSFRSDGPLDMRYDRRQELTAAGIVNSWPKDDLAILFAKYGEERYARLIAEAIIAARRRQRIIGTLQLAGVIVSAVPRRYLSGPIHPATRAFQALRIAVNDELGNLEAALPALLRCLAPSGRLAAISFHSLEDRIVKRFFVQAAKEGKVELINKKPVIADDRETRENPRSRSAKLRAAKKLS